MYRKLQQLVQAQPGRDGAGVAIHRVAGFDNKGMDPVLMIDELRSEHRKDFAAGFPSHPHRGMQTLTYMKHGGIIHEDSQGNRGEIRGGGAQYMSAGRGIIHSEMPTQDSRGLHGFQLWFNLPASEKMKVPRYRDLPGSELGHIEGVGFDATAISGDWEIAETPRTSGPLQELAPQAAMVDIRLDAGSDISLLTQQRESVMAYVYDGALQIEAASYGQRQLLLFGEGDRLQLKGGPEGARLLLLRGLPIGEDVVHYGPFVMNSEREIEQAIRDYQSGRLAG